MTRVEWLALGGDEVETLLANLIYNHDGRAVRIRPSQGDYGIDIVIPAAADATKWDVYQVKKYARNLTPGQKTKIVESFGRVLVGMLRRNVPLNDWYLVLPLDPTLENYLDWLQEVPELAIEKLQKDKKLDPQLSDDEVEQIRTWLAVPDRIIGVERIALLRVACGGLSLRCRLLPARRSGAAPRGRLRRGKTAQARL